MRKIIIIALLTLAVNAYSQTIPKPERLRTYDVHHISMSITPDQENKMVHGNVTTLIVPLTDNFTEFEVDAIAFRIEHVQYKNSDLQYDYDGKKILVKLPTPHSINDTIEYSVKYSCKPQRGLYFTYPTELNPSMAEQVWSQGEGEDNKHWLPIYDYPNDKATTEIYVTVDSRIKTLSNGYLESSHTHYATDRTDGVLFKTDHWVQDKPHSSYLIMLGAGDFDIVEDNASGIPIMSYVEAGKRSLGEYSFRNTAAMMKLYNEKFGYIYPWANYKQVVVKDFIYGGMENTTATVLNERSYYTPEVENDYSSDNLISHELTHQWWGDLITCRNWAELWLNESFAEWGTALWKENYYGLRDPQNGKDEHDYYLLKDGDEAMKVDTTIKRLPIWAGYGDITENLYDKGAVTINMFRHVLGDEKFFASLQTFLKDNEFKNVTTEDLIASVNRTMNDGKDYRWMFDQWIYKAGYPEFQVTYEYNKSEEKLLLHVKQVQKLDSLTPVFRMPVDVRIKNASEDKIVRVEIMDADETFSIPSSYEPSLVQFDHGNKILDRSFVEDNVEQLKSINAVDRIMFFRNNLIKKTVDRDTPKRFIKEAEVVIKKDVFWGARVEAAKYIGALKGMYEYADIRRYPAVDALIQAYNMQTDSRVKREILKAIANYKSSEGKEFIISKIKNEENTYILSDGISALSRSLRPKDVYDTVIPYINIPSHRNMVLGAIVDALDSANNYVKDDRIKDALKTVAFGKDVDSRIRQRAINGLMNYAKDDEIKSLAKRYIDYNFRSTKLALIKILGASGDKSLITFLEEMKSRSSDDSVTKGLDSAIEKLKR